jgi:hypothetical protein
LEGVREHKQKFSATRNTEKTYTKELGGRRAGGKKVRKEQGKNGEGGHAKPAAKER